MSVYEPNTKESSGRRVVRSDNLERTAGERRSVLDRAVELAHSTGLNRTITETVAWKERGFSPSGIATIMGCTEGTADTRLNRAVARCGLGIVYPKLPADRTGSGPITPDTLRGYSEHERERWLRVAQQHVTDVPESVRVGCGMEGESDE